MLKQQFYFGGFATVTSSTILYIFKCDAFRKKRKKTIYNMAKIYENLTRSSDIRTRPLETTFVIGWFLQNCLFGRTVEVFGRRVRYFRTHGLARHVARFTVTAFFAAGRFYRQFGPVWEAA